MERHCQYHGITQSYYPPPDIGDRALP